MLDRGFSTVGVLIILAIAGGIGGFIGKNFISQPVGAPSIIFPIQGGTGTSTVPTADDILIGGDNSRYDVKKLTAGSGITISTSTGSVTITSSGGGGSGTVSTSSIPNVSELAYWTSSGATPELLSGVATTTATIGSGLSYSGTFGALVGGANGTLSFNGVFSDLGDVSTSSDATGDIYYLNSSGQIVNLGSGTNGEILTVSGDIPAWVSTSTFYTVGGTDVAFADGGTGLSSAADDTVLVSNASAWQAKTLPSCSTGSSDKLLYDQSTNTFSCGTDQNSIVTTDNEYYVSTGGTDNGNCTINQPCDTVQGAINASVEGYDGNDSVIHVSPGDINDKNIVFYNASTTQSTYLNPAQNVNIIGKGRGVTKIAPTSLGATECIVDLTGASFPQFLNISLQAPLSTGFSLCSNGGSHGSIFKDVGFSGVGSDRLINLQGLGNITNDFQDIVTFQLGTEDGPQFWFESANAATTGFCVDGGLSLGACSVDADCGGRCDSDSSNVGDFCTVDGDCTGGACTVGSCKTGSSDFLIRNGSFLQSNSSLFAHTGSQTCEGGDTTLTGSIDADGDRTVTGVGTLFTSEVVVGERLTLQTETKTVLSIESNTELTVTAAFSDLANDTTPQISNDGWVCSVDGDCDTGGTCTQNNGTDFNIKIQNTVLQNGNGGRGTCFAQDYDTDFSQCDDDTGAGGDNDGDVSDEVSQCSAPYNAFCEVVTIYSKGSGTGMVVENSIFGGNANGLTANSHIVTATSSEVTTIGGGYNFDKLQANTGTIQPTDTTVSADAVFGTSSASTIDIRFADDSATLGKISYEDSLDIIAIKNKVFGLIPTSGNPILRFYNSSKALIAHIFGNAANNDLHIQNSVANTSIILEDSGGNDYLDCDDNNGNKCTFATGVVIASGGSLQIDAAASPTIDADGEIAIDESNDQFIYQADSVDYVLFATSTASFTLETPDDADNFLLWKTDADITIDRISCIVDPAGSGESVVITVQETDANGDSPAGVDGATTITCANTSTNDDGALSNAAIDEGDFLALDIGTVTGTVTQLNVNIYFKYDRK